MSHFSLIDNYKKHDHRKLAFAPANATDDGLADDIKAEQEEQAIDLRADPDGTGLADFWDRAVQDASQDPDWQFSDDEDEALY